MRGVPLNLRIRRTVAVSLGADLALEVGDTPSGYFPANIAQPQGVNSTSDISPRLGRAASTLTLGPRPPVELHACDRIEAGGVVYELLAAPAPVTEGRATIGTDAPVLPIAELYPRTAAVCELGAEDGKPEGEIECSLFSLAHRNATRGSYDDAFAEAPAAALELLTGSNLELRFEGGEVWKIRSATLSREVPFVAMSVTKA